MQYQSEFIHQKRRRFVAEIFLFCAVVVLGGIFLLVQKLDRADFDAMVDESVKFAIENSRYRDHVFTFAHCRVPTRGERLVMEYARADEPGEGFRCVYYTNVGFGRAPRLVGVQFSRGWKSQ